MLAKKAIEYKTLGAEIAELTAERRIVKAEIIQEMGSESQIIDDGVKITKFAKSIKDLPIESFALFLEEQGIEALYAICKVVQSRLDPDLKSQLVEVAKAAQEIRVTV